jgi:hypothetical protein
MEIQNGPHSLFYACPKYHPDNREPDERACSNRINLVDYEIMLKHLQDILTDAMMHDRQEDLTNHSWVYKGIEFKVFEYTKDKIIKITMTNKKAVR